MPLQGDRCPFCGSSNLGEARIERAFCTDISESPKPQVTAYSLEVRKCLNCGRTLRRQHPQVDPSQRCARCRRSCASCAGYPSLKARSSETPCATTKRRLEEYQQLRASVKDAKWVFTDDTGWRIIPPLQAMENWYQKQPDLFKKEVYNLVKYDTYIQSHPR